MSLVDDRTQRVLRYIEGLRSEGYELTFSELTKFAEDPYRGSDLNLVRAFTEIGRQSVPEFLLAKGWIRTRGRKRVVELTKLGKAVLSMIESQKDSPVPEAAIVLGITEPLSYTRLIVKIAECGECMVADPYFRFENLPDLLEHTSCSRVLTSSKIKKRGISGLMLGLRELSEKGRVCVKVCDAPEFHDRFVIPTEGPVYMVGVSINKIKEKFSVLVPLSSPLADIVRKQYEEFWQHAALPGSDDA